MPRGRSNVDLSVALTTCLRCSSSSRVVVHHLGIVFMAVGGNCISGGQSRARSGVASSSVWVVSIHIAKLIRLGN
jgi:hypothetical protein